MGSPLQNGEAQHDEHGDHSAWRAPLLQGRAAATGMAGCGPPLLRGRAAPLAGGRAVLCLPPSAESPKKRGERMRKEICGWGEICGWKEIGEVIG